MIAVGLNFADTYFRTGLYPIPLPNGMGVEAVRRRRGGRRGRDQRRARRPCDVHRLRQHAGRVQHGADHPGSAAHQAAAGNLLRDCRGDDHARADLRVPDSAHLAAAGRRRRSCCTPRPAASASSSRSGRSCWASRSSVRYRPKPRPKSLARTAAIMSSLYGREDVAKRVRELTERRRCHGRVRQCRQGHVRRLRSIR